MDYQQIFGTIPIQVFVTPQLSFEETLRQKTREFLRALHVARRRTKLKTSLYIFRLEIDFIDIAKVKPASVCF